MFIYLSFIDVLASVLAIDPSGHADRYPSSCSGRYALYRFISLKIYGEHKNRFRA